VKQKKEETELNLVIIRSGSGVQGYR
jgi:hypothetical protein